MKTFSTLEQQLSEMDDKEMLDQCLATDRDEEDEDFDIGLDEDFDTYFDDEDDFDFDDEEEIDFND